MDATQSLPYPILLLLSSYSYRLLPTLPQLFPDPPPTLPRLSPDSSPTLLRLSPTLPYFQFSAIQGVGRTRRYHLPLRPTKASGGLGTPWKTTILAPSGIAGVWKNEKGKYFTQ